MVNKKEDHFFERLFRQEYNSLLDEIEKIKINSIPKERKEKIIKILADYKKMFLCLMNEKVNYQL